MKGVGTTQVAVLQALIRHGSWSAGCGWLWDTPSGTIRIILSLVKRGFVRWEDQQRDPRRLTVRVYKPTESGVRFAQSQPAR